MSAKDIIV